MRRPSFAKTVLFALLCVAITLCLAGCGDKGGEPAQEAPQEAQEEAVVAPLSAEDLAGSVWKAGDGGVTDGFFLHFTSDTRCYLILCRGGGWNSLQRLDYQVKGTTLDLGEGFEGTIADDGSVLRVTMPNDTSWDFERTNGSAASEDELERDLKSFGQIFDLGGGSSVQVSEPASATSTADDVLSVGNITVVAPGWAVDKGVGWIQYGESLKLECSVGGERVELAEIDWDERAATPYEIKEERWELGSTRSSGVMRAVVLHIWYVDADGRVIHWGSSVESDVLAPEYYLGLSADEILSWIEVGPVEDAGSRSADGLYLGTSPFWGVWAYASKDLGEAVRFADDARWRGFDAEVLLTTDWSNLNSEPWYVVTLSVARTEGDAYGVLSRAQADVYGDAYVKWSGDYIG